MKTRNVKTKTLSILLTIVMLLGMLPVSVFAADAEDYITVFKTQVNAGQYFAGGSGEVVDTAPSDNYLYYEGGGKITLKNFVHSDASKYHTIFTEHKDVSITLIGESELTENSGNASVYVNYGKLQISGDGSLKSNRGIFCSGFELSGGNVTADGVTSLDNISITDGELTLTDWSLKAMNDHNISISGGKVTVSGNMYAIYATGNTGTVSITGGEVELTARVSGNGGDKAIFAGTLTIGENMQILAGSSAGDAVAVDAYNGEMYVKITPKAQPEDKVITLSQDDLENGVASGEGWRFEDSLLIISSGYILKFEGTCGAYVENHGTIGSGTFSGEVNNYGTITGGTFSGQVENRGTITGDTFLNSVTNLGSIKGGTFSGNVVNHSTISGGTFTKNVINDGTIENGSFDCTVINIDSGMITDGNFNLFSRVDNEGTIAGGNFSGLVDNLDNATISGGVFTGSMDNFSTVTGTADISTLNSFNDQGGQYGKDVKLPKAKIGGMLIYTGCDSSTPVTLEYYADGVKTDTWTVSGNEYSFPVERYKRTDPAAELSTIEEIAHEVKAASMDGYEITVTKANWDLFNVTVTRTAPDLIITGGTEGTDYTYENGVLDIKAAGTYEIKNADNVTVTDDVIKVSAPEGTVNITLSGVTINVSHTGNEAAFEIIGECTTNLILKDGCENTFDSGYNRAGIANHSRTLVIACEHSESSAHKCSESCGHLRAVGQDDGAGIGGEAFEAGTNITIKGGNIVADVVNSNGSAGIGGGYDGDGIGITISGGTVNATGTNGAGIGGGDGKIGRDITISGGTVTATSTRGAGIGGGTNGDGRDITISDGTVTATSILGAGIGGGDGKIGRDITISGGTVTATSEIHAGIGGVSWLNSYNIIIAPAANMKIYAYNGSDNTGDALNGSPFTTETDITNLLSSKAFYSYAEKHTHNYTYTADENIITETCICGHSETATITAPQNLVYDGTAKAASVDYSENWQGGSLNVTYSVDGCTDAGTVTASIEKDGAKASVGYTIAKANPNCIVPTGLTATYGQTLASVVLTTDGWAWNEPNASVGNAGTNSFKAIFTPTDTKNYNTVTADVEIEVGKAVITVTVDNKTAKQYEELPAFTFTVSGLIQGETLITNPTISTQADMKSAGEFGIVATGADAGGNYTITYVPGKLTVEAHTEHSGGTATCTEKAKCTACGTEYGELAAHSYKDGKCTVCEAADPNYVPETDSPQTGDNSHMALWFVLLFISVGAVIMLNVVNRKKVER